ncbi:MAG: preprotein translocase subunit SecA, partial [Endomicrobium sp.]|nr:preprotein translocase subunit SecA [Endomicrobium sp.]
MLKDILSKIFGTQNERDLKTIKPIIEKVNTFEYSVKKITDIELRAKTIKFRECLLEGQTLDDILPEAFACVREASVRTIGLRHFDVQIMGGYVL